jgi:dolichol-phosphate mannosyltransferase
MSAVVVIPTFSEARNLNTLVSRIWKASPSLDILIVDDSSPDGTGELADRLHDKYPERIFVLHRSRREGLGKAYLDAFHALACDRYEAVIQMDADLSHDPSYLPHFLTAIESADLVLGSRYSNGVSVVNWAWKRLVLSKMANHFVHIVTGLPFSDVTSGYKCWRASVLKSIISDKPVSSGYLFQIEMTWMTWWRRYRVQELPIIFYERQYGQSKLDSQIVAEAILGVCRMRVRQLLRSLNRTCALFIGRKSHTSHDQSS